MNQSSIIDAVVHAVIADSAEYQGSISYKSPRLSGLYEGYIKANLSKGVHGGYRTYDRNRSQPFDSAVIKDEDRGNLMPNDELATVMGTGFPFYTAQMASEVNSLHTIPGNFVDLEFTAFTLDVTYSQQSVSYWRYVLVDAMIPMNRAFQGTFRGRTTVVSQGPNTNDRSNVVAVHTGERLNEIEERSLWFAINLLCGTKSGNYLLEGYDAQGTLVSRQFRGDHEPQQAVLVLFNVHIFPPADFINIFVNGFYEALTDGFPVDVILEQLFDSAASVLDFKIQNCLLAVHAAFEAWHKIQPPEVDAEKNWLSKNKSELNSAIEVILGTAPKRAADAIARGISGAANFSTGDKERRFFADWDIDVSALDERKALALRNGLLHDGYFNKRYEDIPSGDKQFRVNAIGTLKNLVALILFRAVGYSGQFLSQRNFFTHLTAVQGSARFPLPERTIDSQWE